MQFTYAGILWHFPATFVALFCVYSCISHSACKSHVSCLVLYCNLRPVRLYHIFSHYLIKGTIFRKKNTDHKTRVLFLFTTFVWKISNPNKYSATYCLILRTKHSLFLWDLNDTWIFSTHFRKIVQYQISWNLSSWSRIVPYTQRGSAGRIGERTDRQMTKLKFASTILRTLVKAT